TASPQQRTACQQAKQGTSFLHGTCSHVQTTILTSLPGTTITFFGVPSTNFFTFSLASAAASTAALSAALGTRTLPRSLPLTCTTSSISSCSSALASTCG